MMGRSAEGHSASTSVTSLTLLGRLREDPADEESWRRFVERYGAMIEQWCRTWGLQNADAQDVTQNVLVKISKQMRTFEYKPGGRFRSWLRMVAYHAWCDYLAAQRRQPAAGVEVVALLESIEARDNFLENLELECDRNLLEEAMAVVQGRVEENTFKAFTAMAVDGRPGSQVAEELGMKLGTVYVAKSRVQKMLQKLIRTFEEPEE